MCNCKLSQYISPISTIDVNAGINSFVNLKIKGTTKLKTKDVIKKYSNVCLFCTIGLRRGTKT